MDGSGGSGGNSNSSVSGDDGGGVGGDNRGGGVVGVGGSVDVGLLNHLVDGGCFVVVASGSHCDRPSPIAIRSLVCYRGQPVEIWRIEYFVSSSIYAL